MSAINIGAFPQSAVSGDWVALEATALNLNGLLNTLQEDATIQNGEMDDVDEGYESLIASMQVNIIKSQYYANPYEYIGKSSQVVPVGVEQLLCTFTYGFKTSTSGISEKPVAFIGAFLMFGASVGTGSIRKINIYVRDVATNAIVSQDTWFGNTANLGLVSKSMTTYVENESPTLTKRFRITYIVRAEPTLTSVAISSQSYGWIMPMEAVY
jgi:hypothetical protein